MVLNEEQYNDYMAESDQEQVMSFGKAGLQFLWSNNEMPVSFDHNTISDGSQLHRFVELVFSGMNKELCGCFRIRYSHAN